MIDTPNTRKTFCQITGKLHLLFSLFLLFPLPWCFYYEWNPDIGLLFLQISGVVAVIGVVLRYYGRDAPNIILPRDSLFIVGYSWLALVVTGALPYWKSNYIPGFVDAIFESVSGFTTTGASIMTDVEILPDAIQFWRGLTQWIGGMGIIVLFVSVFPNLSLGAKTLFKRESSQLRSDPTEPVIRDAARSMCLTYMVLTILQILLLRGAGMSVLDAMIHTFASISTGGFSSRNASVGAFQSPFIEGIIIVFMYLGSINFGLYYDLVHGKWRRVLKDAELRFFLSVGLIFTGLSTLSLWFHSGFNFLKALRSSAFQISTILTTTGFASDDYEKYPFGPQALIFLCMLMGGMAGSTAGGIKQFRIFLLFKIIVNHIHLSFRPSLVTKLRVGDTVIQDNLLQSVLGFFCVYAVTLAIGFVCLAFSGQDLLTSLTAVMTCAAAAGPGFGMVGPTDNFAALNDFATVVLSVVMLLGRLEFFVLLAFFHPRFWRR
ncbi:MAG: TrkH family potassium uptake protein [SAR324 cluster bacterium]|nr:TrkH family potassium uptake protein [SAR324 cluster bacterium]